MLAHPLWHCMPSAPLWTSHECTSPMMGVCPVMPQCALLYQLPKSVQLLLWFLLTGAGLHNCTVAVSIPNTPSSNMHVHMRCVCGYVNVVCVCVCVCACVRMHERRGELYINKGTGLSRFRKLVRLGDNCRAKEGVDPCPSPLG